MDPLVQALLNSALLVALVTAGGGIVAKIIDNRARARAIVATKQIKAETQEQSSAAEATASEAKVGSDAAQAHITALEKTISDLWRARESDRQLAERNFKSLDLIRAQYADLDQKYYVLRGQNSEQAEQIASLQQHTKEQGEVIEGQKEEISELRTQLGEFQDAFDKLYAVLDSAPDTQTIGELRPVLPARPNVKRRKVNGNKHD